MLKIVKDDSDHVVISNDFISLAVFKRGSKKGTYQFSSNKKDPNVSTCKLENCYLQITCFSGESEELIEVSSKKYSYTSRVETNQDDIGKNILIDLSVNEDSKMDLSFSIRFRMYEKKEFILVQLTDIIDNSSVPLKIHSISPLTIKEDELYMAKSSTPSKLDKISWFKHGWQSWSNCKMLFGNERDSMGSTIDLFFLLLDNQDYKIKGRFYSEYCTIITDLESMNSLVIGFTTLKDQFSRIMLDYENYNTMTLLTAFGCMDGVTFTESTINSSEELFICFKTNGAGYYGLQEYADVVKSRNKIALPRVPVGWCSWYYYYTNISEAEMVKNLEFFKNHADLLPIDFFQLDDGYFTQIGDYNTINSKFPRGLRWLFEEMRKSGVKTGIWSAPFIAERRAQLFKNHRDWFLTDKKNDKLIRVLYNWGAHEFGFDITRKEVLDYLTSFYEDQLYLYERNPSENVPPLLDFAKIDFLYAPCPINSNYSNRILTRAQAFHNGIKIIRETLSKNVFLLGCGAPLGPCVGLVDAMRIGQDTGPSWSTPKVDAMEDFPEQCLKSGMINVLFRSFMHNRFWINDTDCLMIRRTNTDLNLDEIRLQMTIFGLSGGLLLVSDDMSILSEEEISDLQLMIPPYNSPHHNALPVDILYSRLPSIYALETNEPIGKRYLVCIINWEDEVKNIAFKPLDSLPLMPNTEQSYYIFDFWEGMFKGEFKREEQIIFQNVKPHSCKYLAIIPVNEVIKKTPIFLSSNLHISQGCYEIKRYQYDENQKVLDISLNLPGKRQGYLYLKLPDNISISSHEDNFILIHKKENIWQLNMQFKDKYSMKIQMV